MAEHNIIRGGANVFGIDHKRLRPLSKLNINNKNTKNNYVLLVVQYLYTEVVLLHTHNR